jgi:hypothetical protein
MLQEGLMDAFRRFFLFFLVAWSSAAWGRQDSAPDFTPLNGNWELVVDPLDQVRIFGFLLRVEGDKIFGAMDFDLLCRRADGRRSGDGWQLKVQGEIAPDGSFTITNEYPLQLPVHTMSVRGVVPAANADQWSGSFSISVIEGHRGTQCPAASRDFVARRSQQANSAYSGEVKVEGTEEKAWVTLELSPGGLTKWNGGIPPLDRTIGIEARVTVSPTLWFQGGTFSTNPSQRGWINQMDVGDFTAYFPDHLTVSGIFNPWHNHQVRITLTHHDSKGEARWAASGVLTQQ